MSIFLVLHTVLVLACYYRITFTHPGNVADDLVTFIIMLAKDIEAENEKITDYVKRVHRSFAQEFEDTDGEEDDETDEEEEKKKQEISPDVESQRRIKPEQVGPEYVPQIDEEESVEEQFRSEYQERMRR